MPKYTNESDLGRRRVAAMRKPEQMDVAARPSGAGAQKVDPSVTIGPLEGEPRGCVPINSPAYTGKFK